MSTCSGPVLRIYAPIKAVDRGYFGKKDLEMFYFLKNNTEYISIWTAHIYFIYITTQLHSDLDHFTWFEKRLDINEIVSINLLKDSTWNTPGVEKWII